MSAPVTPTPEAVQSPLALSELQRLTYIFSAPSRTFADIRRSAQWWVPFLIMIIASYGFVFTMQKKIGWDQVVESIKANMSEKQKARVESMTPEQQAQQEKGMRLSVPIFSYAYPVLMLVSFLLFALVLMAIFNFGVGTSIAYSRALAITVYASFVQIGKTLLSIIAMFALPDPATFNIETPVATNPGFFLDPNDNPALYRLAASLDIFNIWVCILLGIGFAVVGGKKKKTGVMIVLSAYAVVTLGRMGWAALF
jgi:hypothetical protein